MSEQKKRINGKIKSSNKKTENSKKNSKVSEKKKSSSGAKLTNKRSSVRKEKISNAISRRVGKGASQSKSKTVPSKKKDMRVIPLGGLKEIGKNITLIECNDEILIIDCGFSFPQDEMFGIDVVIPDFSYLRERIKKIKGVVITHGHEDHIGGVPYLLKEMNLPIYGPPLAMGLIAHKLEEHGLKAELNPIDAGKKIKIGSFSVESIRTNHSIADSYAYSIKCPGGHIIHTGDFKVDYSPLDGKRIDLNRFASLGDEGVDLLICDSTNVLRPGYTPSERIVVDSMNKIFQETDKRIIIATFSSNIYRIKYFMEASIKHGRKIAISGRSMEQVINLAKELGYLDLHESAFVDIRNSSNIPDGNLTIITTGSQGEPMSALTRMASDNHKAVKLKKGDVVVFSSSPIPGNERTITNIVNKLYEKDVSVFLSDFVDIHVSGHACKEELKLIHSLLKPKYFMPAHGEYRHLVEHRKLANELGMSSSKIFVMSNGDALHITDKSAKIEEDYTVCDDILVDGYGIGDVGSVVLRDRKQLSEGGLIVITVAVDRNSAELVSSPELITRGFIYVKENGALIDEATEVVFDTIDGLSDKEIRDPIAFKTALRDSMRSFIFRSTKRNPVILPVIMYV